MASERGDFKGVIHIGNTLLMSKLEINLKTWFDWALLRVGGWTDVVDPTLGAFGGDFSELRLVDDPSYTAGTVWEAVRKDWVWESGVNYVDTNTTTQNPTSPVVTVTVNGTPTAFDHINYLLGRVIFPSAIPSTSTVKAEYSYRWAQVYRSKDVPWWHELQYRSLRTDDSQINQLSTGEWSVGSQHRIQMPCIIIESVPRTRSRPYQIGDGSAWVEQDVLCHVLAENSGDRNNLVDIIRSQFDTVIWLFDNDAVAAAGDFPLDYRGEIVDNTKTYTALVDEATGHRWKTCRFRETTVSEVEALNSRLHQGLVRITCEVILDD